MPEITVGLPLYGSHWAWIALESLCRQQCTCEWELIVCEEQTHNKFGIEKLQPFNAQLKNAGCVRMKYVPIPTWINLGRKWIEIAKNAHADSKMLLLQASDDYSHPYRIQTSFNAMREGADLFWQNKAVFYHLWSRKFLLYRNDTPTILGVNIGLRTEFVRNAEIREKARQSFDFLLYLEIKKQKENAIENTNDDHWDKGLFTDGYNRLSPLRRIHAYTEINPYKSFSAFDNKKLWEYIPMDMAVRLTTIPGTKCGFWE